MAEYYCLMAGAPDISLGDATKADIEDFKAQCEASLSDADKAIIGLLSLQDDCLALVAKLESGESIDIDDCCLPQFAKELAASYSTNKDKQSYYLKDHMLYEYYRYGMACNNSFVAQWFELNYNIQTILTALIARTNNWNIADYIYGDNDITELIKTKTSNDFDLAANIDYIAALLNIVQTDDPVEKERLIDAFKWAWLDEQTFFNMFSIEAVFAYICKLNILNRWAKLDIEQGKATFTNIIETMRSQARVPDAFIRK